jgi:hypothetical protein
VAPPTTLFRPPNYHGCCLRRGLVSIALARLRSNGASRVPAAPRLASPDSDLASSRETAARAVRQWTVIDIARAQPSINRVPAREPRVVADARHTSDADSVKPSRSNPSRCGSSGRYNIARHPSPPLMKRAGARALRAGDPGLHRVAAAGSFSTRLPRFFPTERNCGTVWQWTSLSRCAPGADRSPCWGRPY